MKGTCLLLLSLLRVVWKKETGDFFSIGTSGLVIINRPHPFYFAFLVFLSLDVVSEFGGRTNRKRCRVLVSFAQMQAETDAL